jgi:integrase/recombinase XerD
MRKPKVTQTTDIPVVIDNTEQTPQTNAEIQEAMNKYRAFGRSLFGDDFVVGAVKLNRGKIDPAKITLLKVQSEFILAQKARGNSEQTIKSYEKNFNRIYDFVSVQYLKSSKEIREEVLENVEKYGSARQIGASMPVLVFEIPNFIAYFKDYLERVAKVSPQTILSSVRHVKAIIYFAQEQGWIKEFGIKVKELKPEIKSTFTKEELTRLSKKPKLRTDNFVEYRTWVMIQYLSATGNRIGSVLALNVGDIDFENNTIRINITKNNEPKLMPLIYDVRKVLNEYIYKTRTNDKGDVLHNEPLFPNQDGLRLSYEGARDAFKDFFEARGVLWEGFHKFRHSYAANWIRDGGNPFMLKEQLGHSSLAMTNRYANIYGMATKKEAEEHSLTKQFPRRGTGNRIKNKL